MKTIKLTIAVVLLVFTTTISAQTVDEILANYLEAIGGKENLLKIRSIKMSGKINAQGMEIPLEIVSTKDGKMYVQIDLQGRKIKQLFSNGNKVWMHNMMNQSTEEMPAEESKMMLDEFKDFPNAFINYNEKGYTVELIGDETKEGTECFKIKLTKKPLIIEGKEVPNISFFYFEKETFVPILIETEMPSGPAKGQIMKTPLSDYQEVDGIYFPFSTEMQGMQMTYSKIELNPTVDDKEFELPEETTPETKDGDKH